MAMTAQSTEVLSGIVERVTFHNCDSGFCVIRVKARGHKDLVTVVGHAAVVAAGEFVQISGTWRNDRTHGFQFRASFLKTATPTTLEGIERYLGSGMIRGIGPIYAAKLTRAFGETVFDVIEESPERLRGVAGIGPVRARRIIDGWARSKGRPGDHALSPRTWRGDHARRQDLQDLRAPTLSSSSPRIRTVSRATSAGSAFGPRIRSLPSSGSRRPP
jgi:ATP-dependent exoDNAse (exonuclease V) alpha subunit